MKTQFQSSKGRLLQKSEEVPDADEEYRVPPPQGCASSKDCWGDKEQMKALGRRAGQPSSLEDISAGSSVLPDASFHGRRPG